MKRKQHSAQFKTKVALQATKGQKTINQLASECGVHPTQISHLERQLQEGVQEIFSSKRQKQEKMDVYGHVGVGMQAQAANAFANLFDEVLISKPLSKLNEKAPGINQEP